MTTTTTTPFVPELDDDGNPIVANTLEWARRRRTGVGASDAAPILGLSRYSSPRDVWLSKVSDTISREQTEAMEMGHRLEPVIIDIVRDRHGARDEERHRYLGEVERVGQLFRSTAHPHLLASFDALIHEPDGTVAPMNAKNVSPFTRRSWYETDFGAPDHIAVQVFHEAIVAGTDHGYVAPFYGNTLPEPIRLDVPADFREWYVEESRGWFTEHVIGNVEPAPTLIDDLSDVWHVEPGEGAKIALTEESLAAVRRIKRLKALASRIDDLIEAHQLTVKTELGEHTEGVDILSDPLEPKTVVTWRQNKASADVIYLDDVLLLADHPELRDLLDGYRRSKPGRKAARPFVVK